MRGPGIRLQHDVRRLWRCPVCHYERHVPATEVAVHCHCSKDRPLMKLVEPQRKVRTPTSPVDLYLTFDDLYPDDAPPHPANTGGEPEVTPAIPLHADVADELGDDPILDEPPAEN